MTPVTPRVDVIQTGEGFARLRDEWTRLVDDSDSDSLFVTWEWLYTWWSHLGNGAAPFIVTVRERGQLIAIAPFMHTARTPLYLKWMPRLSILGRGDVGSDYVDVIARRGAEAAAARTIASMLKRRGLMLELPRLRTGSTADHLAESLEGDGWTRTVACRDVCPYIDLAGLSWSQYLQTLGATHRYNFRRRLRSLQKAHVVRFHQVVDSDERGDALEVLIRLHNLRWGNRGGSTAFHRAALVRFHHAMTALALDRGWLRLFVLWLDDRPAAALYGFTYSGRFYFYQSGFDPAFNSQSVGLVTMGLAIAAACDEHVEEFDMLHGAEAYKFLWARETHHVVSVELYPPHLTARVFRFAADTKRAASRLVHRYLTRKPLLGLERMDHDRSPTVVPTTR